MPIEPWQIAVGVAGVLSPVVTGGLALLINRNLKLQDEAKTAELAGIRQLINSNQEAMLAEIRATRSDVRILNSDVTDHTKRIAALADRVQSLQDQAKETRDDVKRVIRDGCALAARCGASK